MKNKIYNDVCRYIPYGYEIQLRLEQGAAYVTLTKPDGSFAELPDTAEKTIDEQIMDALSTAIKLSA